MKIIALLPFKNESWILPTYLSGIKEITDEIVAIDDGSTDNSRAILESAGAIVYSNDDRPESGWAEHSIRERLLLLGRKHGGTHFICLDADESFSNSSKKNLKPLILSLKPGQRIDCRWITIWKDALHERADGVFSKLFKDFIFCDSLDASYSYAFLGVSRTPSTKNPMEPIKHCTGGVLHFQYLHFNHSQLKQAWYRCSEQIKGARGPRKINATYSISLENNDVETKDIPDDEVRGLLLPQAEGPISDDWHFDEILCWFKKYGIIKFEPLQIWHISELRDIFTREMGRLPKPKVFGPFILRLNSMRHTINHKKKSLSKVRRIPTFVRNHYFGYWFAANVLQKAPSKIKNYQVFCEHFKKPTKNRKLLLEFIDGYKIKCTDDDLGAIGETCLLEDYEKKLPQRIQQNSIVFDVGAHIGSFSIHAASKGALVYSFEPNPNSYARLVENIRLNNLEGRIRPFNTGVWYKDETLDLHIGEHNSAGSSLFNSEGTIVPISLTSLSKIIDSEKIPSIDLLKIDIEGSEYEIFKNLSANAYDRIRMIVGEYHLLRDNPGWNFKHLKSLLSPHFRNISRYNPYYFIARR